MTVEIFCLCEAASIKDASICILHTYANTLTDSQPALVMGCLVAQVRFMHNEEGDHKLQCELVDADGIKRWESAVAVTSVSKVSGSQGWPQIFIMQAELFPGQHEIRLKLDNEIVATCLYAIIYKAPSPNAPKTPPSIV
jgi:hypothetical protein